MSETANIALPLLAAAQAQKHVTHNEALLILDSLVQLACLDKDLTAPPSSPKEGDRYLIAGSSPSGAWAGWAGRIARFRDGQWTSLAPKTGWLAYVADEKQLYAFDGQAWAATGGTSGASGSGGAAPSQTSAALFGINTQADTTNRLAVKSDAVLLAWDDVTPGSGDLRVTLNKKAAARDAGFAFQTGYSTRALCGTFGSDDFVVKTSADGTAFTTALTAAAATGIVAFAASPTAPTPADRDGSTRLATTAYVDRAGAAAFARSPVADAAYTIQPTDRTVAVTALTAARTLTLPAASAFPPGATLTILDESGACSPGKALTIARAGSDTINGLTALLLATPYGAVSLQSNGAAKWTITDRITGMNRRTFVDVSGLNTNQTVGSAFTRITLTQKNDDTGGNWDTSSSLYTCPRRGVYQITGSLRVADATGAGTQYGVAVHTTETDGPWFLWHSVGPAPSVRSTYVYSRLTPQAAGDQLRMFSYSDQGVKIIGAGLQICLVSEGD
ncbi:DUF2793 domain-containing protein [Methylobacterium aerolatum]|uniref:DUF2793 domain-containing protein n=1 Tax=Methylobacterium aerolatum TaxID=418708 RepID=A0ABU0I2K0_9HYPH|nr:DUF2793 domain-containing protein [Methylobacterium aerolatum]MDQ0448838.1 hypothetical protein [Methylobacterium aerolatum]GJD34202.1 hypothetical protein FMGBMHLM_1098 [Methylobacterium aerolatum]